MTDEQEKQLEELFKTKLKEQYNRGLQIGILSVSKVVIDKLNDNSKPLMERIEDVKKFCSTPWNKQKIEQDLNETYAKSDHTAEDSNAVIQGSSDVND